MCPGSSGPDGVHYEVHGNLWAGLAGLGGIVEIDPRISLSWAWS
jgi:gluconolactonase